MRMGQDELMDAVRDAAGNGQRPTGECADAYLAIVRDGVQARREWAVEEEQAIMRAGAAARWKRHRKAAGILPAVAGKAKLAVSTIVGVTAVDGWVQKSLGDCDLEQVTQAVTLRERARNRASVELAVLRRYVEIYRRHPVEPTLDDALRVEGTCVADVAARAS